MSAPPLQFSNTLSGKKEPFQPIDPGQVRMYVCGITPYDESHLGHARCYVFFDIVKRTLKALGYSVRHVQNFTDVDDKIIARSAQTNETPLALADRCIESYFDKMERLNVQRADVYPRVTGSVPQIVQFIEKLIAAGKAYELEGDVYYAVRKFPGYGKLSKRSLDELESGARVEVDERKKDPLDFALWKKAKPGEPSWESPWGAGRPGWHIECSVMSMEQLGETFDIHGGGLDLIFPHHENEIAQSEGASGKPFARYWMHNGFVTVNQEKMSKSLGNFFTLADILAKFPPEIVRFFLLTRHYKTPLDFSDDLLIEAKNAYRGIFSVYNGYVIHRGAPTGNVLDDRQKDFMKAMADDFNTEKALSIVFQLRTDIDNKLKQQDWGWLNNAAATLRYFCEDLLGIRLDLQRLRPDLTPERLKEAAEIADRRLAARKAKNWAQADQDRAALTRLGLSVEDTAGGYILKPDLP